MAVTEHDLEEVQKLTKRLREIVELGEAQLAEREPNLKAINDRMDLIEAKSNRPSLFGENNGEIIDLDEARERREKAIQQKNRRKAFQAWARKGLDRTPKVLREHLVPPMPPMVGGTSSHLTSRPRT